MPIRNAEKPLKQVLGDDGSDSLIRLLNQIQIEQKEDVLEFVEEKFERRLTEKISGVKERITEEISGVREEISRVRVDTHKSQVSLLKWLIGIGITQIATVAGLLIAFLNK